MSLHRINFFILLIFAIAVGIGTYFSYEVTHNHIQTVKIAGIKGDILELGYSLEKTTEADGIAGAKNLLYRSIATHKEYKSLALITEGRLLFSTDRHQKKIPEYLPLEILTPDSMPEHLHYSHQFYFLENSEKKNLQLLITLSDTYLHTIEREMLWLIEQQFILLIGAMVLLFTILFYFNIKPIVQLTKSIQESPGALPSFHILEFNTLRNVFLQKYEELSALNANLEQKVKERTETLARTNDLFAKAQAIAHLGNWEWNIVENTVHWSDEIYRIFGLQPKAFAATYEAFINTVHPQDRDLVQKAIETFLLDGNTYDVKHRIVLPTGEIRIVTESGHMSRDKDGNNLSMFGTVQDITDQQAKEDELSFHDEILNSLSDSIFVHQENGPFIYVNEAAYTTRGFSQKELLNMTVSQLDVPGFNESVEAIKQQMIQTGSATFEVAHRRKSGAPIPVEIVSRMIQRDGQNYFISIARDITQRKESEKQIIESEAKFRALVENSLVGVYQSDIQGNIYYVNDALASIMEYESPEALMAESSVLVYKDPRERIKMLKLLEEKGKVTNYELELITHKKRQIIILISAVFDGNLLSGTIVDVSREKDVSKQLQKLSSALEQIDDIVTITNRAGTIEYVNEAFVKHTGYSREEIYGHKANILKSGQHDQTFYETLWDTILSGQVYKNRVINRKKNGELYYEQKTITPLKDDNGHITVFVSTAKDVTQAVRSEKMLEQMAKTDKLTGIYNRHSFEELSDKEIAGAERYETPLSLIMLDIDHFKHINDTYGHDIGDSVLKELVSVVNLNIRKSDIFARWGGEEFLILCSNTDQEQAIALANKLRQEIEAKDFTVAGRVTSSFGVAQLMREETKEMLLKHVDDALYYSKEHGRNRVTALP